MTDLEAQFDKLKSLLGEAMLEIAYLRLALANRDRTIAYYCELHGGEPNKSAKEQLRLERMIAEMPTLPMGKAS